MSGRQSVVFGRLEVRRSPGIQTPYALDDLCEGINVIHGPNASGKTTSAQAIHALLWPDPPCWPRGALSGQLRFDGSEWFLDFDAGQFRCQRDGADGSRLNISGPETRDRYILTLHDLLKAEDQSFAGAILRESVGGYDVDAAVAELGYRASPSRPASLLNRLTEARESLKNARREQHELVTEQEGLAELKARRDDARLARSRVDVLERAVRVKEAEQALDEARRTVASLPQSLERLRGDEVDTLKDLRKRLQEFRKRQQQAETEISSATDAITESRLDEFATPLGIIGTLRARCQKLQDLTAEATREKRAWHDALNERESARARIGDRIQESQLNEIEATGLRELAELVRRYEAAQAAEEAQTALQEWVGDVVPSPNLDQLREGISCLNRWLRTPEAGSARADAKLVRLARVAAVLVIVLSILLAILSYWFFALIALIGGGLLILARPASTNLQAERLRLIQDDYRRLGLEPIDDWTSEDVAKVLDRLLDELRKGIVDDEKAQRWGKLAEKRESAAATRTQLEAQRDRLADRYGLAPTSSIELQNLALNLDRWQVAEVEARQARINLNQANETRDQLLKGINEELAGFGYQPAADHAAILANIEDLNHRFQSVTDATRTIAERQRSLNQNVLPEIERLEQQIRAMFEQLDLAVNDDQALRDLVGRLAAYQDAVRHRQEAEFELGSAESNLGEHEELKRRELSELIRERDQVQELAGEYDGLHRQVVGIETLIDNAKKNKHDVERAMSAEAEALEALRDERESQYRLVAGWSLGEFIRQQTRDRDRPRVFHRARELFSRITYGRYRLEFGSNPGPEFRATDTTTGVGLGLDELSSATRVQLLMAVRMAFVEEMEQGPKLPLILDEVLGNSDESRARAIIDATIEICRSGRQVFYFTAQHDEVGKWIRILNDHPDVTYRELDLAQARGLAEIERLPTIEVARVQTQEVPSPSGKTRFAYRELIGVPGIDPWSDAGSVHLWYLVHDTGALYHLLRNHVHAWGQLKNLVEFGGASLLAEFPGTYERARARAEIVRAAIDAWRIGRGRSIDRAVLLDSGAISERFIDEVSKLADRLNGDAAEIVTALEEGQVKGFRRSAIDDLRAYCLDHAYLADDEPLTIDDLRVRVLAAVADDHSTGLVSAADVDELVGNVTGREEW